ncbi:MAG TPA: S8 family serine peptidase [Albitalea sp.]|nr:S8 family serine peptidase [Albitalea sp.]
MPSARKPPSSPSGGVAPDLLPVSAGSLVALTTRPLPSGATHMEPRLQRAIALHSAGMRRQASASTAEDEIAVIAKVSDLTQWTTLSEVRPGEVLGRPDSSGNTMVTARIPIRRIEFVRSQPFVVSLKAAQRVHQNLASTLPETQSRRSDLPAGSRAAGGKGVVVGIVDFGGDFAHENFMKPGRKTRLRALWNQNDPKVVAGATPKYGVVHRPAAINAALKKSNPYAALEYPIEAAAHGTHVMDIAAGNGRGSAVPGMAPAADLVFVELASSDVPWEGPEVVNKSFGDSVQLLEAIAFIFTDAGKRPCVVNMSLGTNGGPHDGSTLVEQGIDRLVRAAPNRAVVISASNSFADGIHAQGNVPAGAPFDLQVRTLPGQSTEDEVEIWYPGAHRLSVELIAPDGSSVGVVGAGDSAAIERVPGQPPVGVIANRLDDPNNHDNVINVWLAGSMPKGIWSLRLVGGPVPVPFHAWIERNDSAQASFATARDDSHTLGSISCGHESIVVASYDAHKASLPTSFFSSAGPTRDGRQKPELAAPGHAVVAARSKSKTGTTTMSGTSMASPAVAGLVALVLAEAHARGKPLSSAQIRDVLIKSARLKPPAAAWDARLGFGRISGKGAIAWLIADAPVVKGKTAKRKKAQPPGATAVVVRKAPRRPREKAPARADRQP